MDIETIKRKFNEGKNCGYSHMLIFKDIIEGNDCYFYVRSGNDVDDEIAKITEVETFKLKAIFNYSVKIENQINEVLSNMIHGEPVLKLK